MVWVAMLGMGQGELMIFVFKDFELDEELYELRRKGVALRLEPKAFDVLLHLVRHRDHVVTKDELLNSVWSGEYVTESVLPKAVNAVRTALQDNRKKAAFVATVRGRGYRFIAAVESQGTRAALQGDEAPAQPKSAGGPDPDLFYGRDATLAELVRDLERAQAGRGGVVVLSGEAGIGKSTTFEKFCDEARSHGARVLVGRCSDREGAPAFWPWTQILRALLAETSDAEFGHELAAIVPEFAESERADKHVEDLDRFRLFETTVEVLRGAAAQTPLVIGIEDLHWADTPSLMLLQFFVQVIATEPIFVVTSCRELDLEITHPLRRTLGEVASHAHGRRIAIEGLGEEEVRDFLEGILGMPVRRSLATAVFEKTEGNPFFIREVARALLASEEHSHDSQLKMVRETIPRSVREAIAQRLAELPSACQELLTLASVVGREFQVALLEYITGRPGEEIWDDLEPAFAAHILVDSPTFRLGCAFTHALIAEGLYQEIAPRRRPSHHLAVAEGLEKLHAQDVEPVLSELAWHFYAAIPHAPRERAIEYGLRAARRSDGRLAYEKAASICERLIELLDTEGSSDRTARLEALFLLGDQRLRAGDQQRSREAFELAAELARILERPEDVARAAVGCAGWSETAGQPDAVLRRLLEEALEGLPAEEQRLRMELLGRLANTDRYYRSREERSRLTASAEQIARQMDDASALCEALANRLVALQGPDGIEDWLALSDECLRLAERTRNHPTRLKIHWYRFGAYLIRGDLENSRSEVEAHGRLCREQRVIVPTAFQERMRATQAMMAGDRAEAVSRIQSAFSIGRRTASPTVMTSFFGVTAWLLKDWEELGQIEPWFQQSRQPYFDWAERPMEVMYLLVLEEVGRTADLRRRFTDFASEGFSAQSRDQLWMTQIAEASRLCFALADRERAEELRDLLLPYSGLHVVETQLGVYGGPVDGVLGLLEEVLGNPDAAIGRFEAAIRQAERMGAVVYGTRAHENLARVLHARGSGDDRDRAREFARIAEANASRLGLARLQGRAQEILGAA